MSKKIRNKYVSLIIFYRIKNKKKLNNTKYNKNIVFRWNIEKKDFKVYEAFKE